MMEPTERLNPPKKRARFNDPKSCNGLDNKGSMEPLHGHDAAPNAGSSSALLPHSAGMIPNLYSGDPHFALSQAPLVGSANDARSTRIQQANFVSMASNAMSLLPSLLVGNRGIISDGTTLHQQGGIMGLPWSHPSFQQLFLQSSLAVPQHIVFDTPPEQPMMIHPPSQSASGLFSSSDTAMPPPVAEVEPSSHPYHVRSPVLLYLDKDDEFLSPYQCVARRQIEVFGATNDDLKASAQGRNKPIVLGQVGIRCRHCSRRPAKERKRGAVYYPSQLEGVYQTAQNMTNVHLLKACRDVPADIRTQLQALCEKKSSSGGGKDYWKAALNVLGVEDGADRRLVFRK